MNNKEDNITWGNEKIKLIVEIFKQKKCYRHMPLLVLQTVYYYSIIILIELITDLFERYEVFILYNPLQDTHPYTYKLILLLNFIIVISHPIALLYLLLKK